MINEAEAMKSLSDARIRRNQALVNAQIKIAYANGNIKALETLYEWERGYADEMMRRHFGA